MEFKRIFVDKLFAVKYDHESQNEYYRLLDLWNDTLYLTEFLNANKGDLQGGMTVSHKAKLILDDAAEIEDTLLHICNNDIATLDYFFKSLNDNEHQIRELSLRKGRAHDLRLYAIRIDADCYLITGGAIKLTKSMNDRPHTQKEWQKLNMVKDFLKVKGVFDEDSFFDLLTDK